MREVGGGIEQGKLNDRRLWKLESEIRVVRASLTRSWMLLHCYVEVICESGEGKGEVTNFDF